MNWIERNIGPAVFLALLLIAGPGEGYAQCGKLVKGHMKDSSRRVVIDYALKNMDDTLVVHVVTKNNSRMLRSVMTLIMIQEHWDRYGIFPRYGMIRRLLMEIDRKE